MDALQAYRNARKHLDACANRLTTCDLADFDRVVKAHSEALAAARAALKALPNTKQTRSGLTLYLHFNAAGTATYVSVPQ